jgi:hypothetical protein
MDVPIETVSRVAKEFANRHYSECIRYFKPSHSPTSGRSFRLICETNSSTGPLHVAVTAMAG